MTPSALLAAIEAGTAPTILDVRSSWEFGRGHVPGAIHIPFWSVPVRVADVPGSRHDPIVVYCGHGPRAWFAGAVLWTYGYRQVRYLKGHMSAWMRSGFREERERGGDER